MARGKIKASSLLEVIVAMGIILIVFAAATMIITNVTRSSPAAQKLEAMMRLEDLLVRAEQQPKSGIQTFNQGDFHIEQTINVYPGNTVLFEIDLVAYDRNGGKVAELRKIIQKSHE